MAHTNSTTNYNLPQFISTDKPAWLSDVNGAMSDIDAAIHNAATDAATADGKADTAISDASDALDNAVKALYYQPTEKFKLVGTIMGVANGAGSQITALVILPRECWNDDVGYSLTDAVVSNIRCEGVSYTSSNVTASIQNGNNLKLTITPSSNVQGNRVCAVGFSKLEVTFIANTP